MTAVAGLFHFKVTFVSSSTALSAGETSVGATGAGIAVVKLKMDEYGPLPVAFFPARASSTWWNY